MTSHNRLEALRDRAAMLQAARSFFIERGLTEVDCPLLNHHPAMDLHIGVIPATYAGTERCYLHTSPEYGMKRLLSEGIGDIFQLSHVFRDAESGQRHNPEFCMAEWYRIGWTLEELQDETSAFIQVFIGQVPTRKLPYRTAFQDYAGIDIYHCSDAELKDLLGQEGLSGSVVDEASNRDALLNLIMGAVIEAKLGRGEITIITDYPASQAELARTYLSEDGCALAARFESYFEGIELSNGYHELLDAQEQRRRFEKRCQERIDAGLEARSLDEPFLAALEKGVPDCCGVAVGFDRLMMLRRKAVHIEEVLPFAWDRA